MALALGLLLASGASLALGLGEIRVKSRPGQPLLAEIPVISSDPSEMEQLRAQLASPETFDRVGLQRPAGLVSELDFATAVGDNGQPVIRVTSRSPVQQAALNFLIEVDWGQGRLVREYSALVDAPEVLAAAPAPVVETPIAAPSDQIVREPEPAAEPAPAPAPAPPPVQPSPRSPPQVAAYSEANAPGSVTVASGQTLSQLARQLLPQSDLNQAMQALLQANPDAFIGGNINRLKQGAVLRTPDAGELATLDAAQAAAFVRQQRAQWRGAPATIAEAGSVPPIPLASDTPARSAPRARRIEDARLQIAPPMAAGAAQAGTTTGIQAGGKGDMLAEQQLQQSREDLAAREAEVQELRAQVAELEKIKAQQDKLIQMKDSNLAAAQQKLAQNQGSNDGTPAWLWGGIALLALGLLVAWLLGRRKVVAAPAPARNTFDSRELAAAMPATAAAVAAHDAPATEPVPERPSPDLDTQLREDWQPETELSEEVVAEAASPSFDPALNVVSLNAAPAGRERLELAIAYLDLGDIETARDLLGEVVAGGDQLASLEAAQLLRELG